MQSQSTTPVTSTTPLNEIVEAVEAARPTAPTTKSNERRVDLAANYLRAAFAFGGPAPVVRC